VAQLDPRELPGAAGPSIRRVHIRRALLLFAIVLGMAALVASLSRPIEDRRDETTPREPSPSGPATATPSPAPTLPAAITFDAAKDQTKKVNQGSAVTIEVSVPEPGTVAVPDLGVSAPAEPLTPARFDILATDSGRYELVFAPAAGESTPQPAGELVITSEG
jgi:hypothetical protein